MVRTGRIYFDNELNELVDVIKEELDRIIVETQEGEDWRREENLYVVYSTDIIVAWAELLDHESLQRGDFEKLEKLWGPMPDIVRRALDQLEKDRAHPTEGYHEDCPLCNPVKETFEGEAYIAWIEEDLKKWDEEEDDLVDWDWDAADRRAFDENLEGLKGEGDG